MSVNPNDAPRGYKAIPITERGCLDCAFIDDNEACRKAPSCVDHRRLDRTEVIYVKEKPQHEPDHS